MTKRWSSFFLGLLWICAAPSPVLAQLSVDGYVVTFPSVVEQQPDLAMLFGIDKTFLSDVTRLRLRPSYDLSASTYIRLEYEMSATYLSSAGVLLSPSSARGQVFEMTWNAYRNTRWNVDHGVDRLFIRTMVGSVDVTVGRQRIAWGSGRIWNPTDLFNPLNPARFSKIEKDGVDAATATVRLGDLSDVTAVWNPQRDRTSSFGFRARANWRTFDLAAIGGRFDDVWVMGGDLTGAVLDAGIRAEAICGIPLRGTASEFWRVVAGIDNQFTGRLYGLLEYHFNGTGSSTPSAYDLFRLMRGEILQVGRHYVALQGSYLLHPLVSLQAGLVRNMDDRSGYAGGTVTVSITDETSLAVGGQYTFGDTFTEYWYYPRSYYLRTDMFF